MWVGGQLAIIDYFKMKKAISMFLFSCLFITGICQDKICFTIENILVKNDSDKLYLEYRITNTTKSNINIIEAKNFTYLTFFRWALEIKDSHGNNYESGIMIKRKPVSEKDFICLKPDSSFLIKYNLKTSDFMIFDSTKTTGLYPYKPVQQINYPITIVLKYHCDGTYFHSRKRKTKKMENAEFSCGSKGLILNKN